MPDYSGQSIGRYHIIEPLGQGGMATVYRAFDTRLECDVAVKFIRMERLTQEETEKTLKRFEREAKELARLTHPNIVKVTDFGKYRGTPYLVMEYLPGGTLKDLAEKPLPYDQAARLLAPVGRALEYAHEENLIHRDVKPGNILLTAKGQPMVSDFGIAKILDVEGGNTLTSTNVAIGTPEYMAPEQWLNQISPQSDIYALGIVFYELVTGQRPYIADTPAAVFLKQSNDPLPRPRSFVPGLPEEVEKVLYKALAKRPEERYASMGEFAAALEGLASPDRPSRPVQTPQPEVPEQVIMRPETPVASPKPPELEVLQTEKTRLGMPVVPQAATSMPVAGVVELPPADSGIIPASLLPKAVPARSPVSRWGWVAGGIIVLIGLLALAGWGISKYVFHPAAMPAAPTQTQRPATTATPMPTLTPALGIGSTQVSPKDGMLQVYVPAGEFLMGSDPAKDNQESYDELPQHTVYLDAFWIDQTDVTTAQYAGCVTSGQCTKPYDASSATRSSYYGDSQYADYPVIYVSWNQAQAYCAWAGRRLPSEAEWEKAARGVDGRIYPWGNAAPDQNKLTYNNNQGDTAAVGSYSSGASPYGALDMAGNVEEWVNDWYSSSYYQQSPSRNPTGPTSGTARVLRGGYWGADGRNVRSAARDRGAPVYRYFNIGFRCAAGTSP
jgi:serine/threonine-protein kinase